jgi:DUF1009 family protein
MFKICLIIGGGKLPFEIIANYKKDEVFIIALKEAEIEYSKLEGFSFQTISFVKVGKMINLVKKHKIQDVCFVGSVKKPNFRKLFPDFKGFFLLFQILKLKMKGDDNLLKTIINFVEKNGLNIKGASELAGNLVIQKGILTKSTPSTLSKQDGELGFDLLQTISRFDVGQSVAIQEGIILGIEGLEGTDALIQRAGELRYKSKNAPILVKSSKVGQTLKIDMPTFGLKTMQNLHKAGFSGIFVESGKCIFIEQQEAIEFANLNNMFIVGI